MDRTQIPSKYQPEDLVPNSLQDQAHSTVSFCEGIIEKDNKDMKLEERQAILIRTFAGHLKAEGLDSPQFYLNAEMDDTVFNLWKTIMREISISS